MIFNILIMSSLFSSTSIIFSYIIWAIREKFGTLLPPIVLRVISLSNVFLLPLLIPQQQTGPKYVEQEASLFWFTKGLCCAFRLGHFSEFENDNPNHLLFSRPRRKKQPRKKSNWSYINSLQIESNKIFHSIFKVYLFFEFRSKTMIFLLRIHVLIDLIFLQNYKMNSSDHVFERGVTRTGGTTGFLVLYFWHALILGRLENVQRVEVG